MRFDSRTEEGQHDGGRAVYFRDPSGHLLGIVTHDYTGEMFKEMEIAGWKE